MLVSFGDNKLKSNLIYFVMNSQLLEKIEKSKLKKTPDLRPGDFVRVHQKIREGKKERTQIFEGVVLRVKGSGTKRSFIVRKVSFGVGVERCFLIHAPTVEKIEVKKRAKIRRAYLSYLRNLTGKKTRLRDKQFDSLLVNVQESSLPEEIEEEKNKQSRKEASDKRKDKKSSSKKEKTSSDDGEKSSDEQGFREVPLSKLEKEEEKEMAAEDEHGSDNIDEGGQAAEVDEIEKGLEEADRDIEKGKNKSIDRSEKTAEDMPIENN